MLLGGLARCDFSSVSAAVQPSRNTTLFAKNLRSAQFLPEEIVTFCAETGMSGLENGGEKTVSGVSRTLISFQSTELRSHTHSWWKGTLLSLRAAGRMQGIL